MDIRKRKVLVTGAGGFIGSHLVESRQQMEMEVKKRHLGDRFVFAGNRDDVPRMLAAMDVFVMPSLDEGFGLAVAEAQLSELPVVASDLPGIREALCPSMHKFCRHPLGNKGRFVAVDGKNCQKCFNFAAFPGYENRAR
ncbi:MAG: glycosyltransferase [Planctomycetota bacterium]|nr:glycosyltransferase [Planctomycetota bacterium]